MDDNLSDAEMRTRHSALDDGELERIFSARELQSLHFGHRERVTDLELARIRDVPSLLPQLFADSPPLAAILTALDMSKAGSWWLRRAP
jgi:hypothetical protein